MRDVAKDASAKRYLGRQHPTSRRGGVGVIASVEDCFGVVGLPVAVRAGSVVVSVRRAGGGCFRLSVCTGWPGVELASVSFHSEAGVRQAARVATALFGAGWAVRQVVEVVEVLAAGSRSRRRSRRRFVLVLSRRAGVSRPYVGVPAAARSGAPSGPVVPGRRGLGRRGRL
jgi:hypothetical protein